MRKRDSKRRWKARCRAGSAIPVYAIFEHQLERWFVFDRAATCTNVYFVVSTT
jgi:hypothetical protein